MAENLKVGGEVFVEVDHITVREVSDTNEEKDVAYYRQGQGGGGRNYRTATEEEIKAIFKVVK
jgi:hypothetical protein